MGEDIRHWEEGKSMIFDDTFNHEVWNDTDETRVVLFVDVLRPLPSPGVADQPADRQGDRVSPFVLDAKRNQEAWEARYRERVALAGLAASAGRRLTRGARLRSMSCQGTVFDAQRVERRELAGEDQHAEHDHHRAADAR